MGSYGADKGSASIDHYSRLPRFCNYKAERVDNGTGKSAWVKLIQGTPDDQRRSVPHGSRRAFVRWKRKPYALPLQKPG